MSGAFQGSAAGTAAGIVIRRAIDSDIDLLAGLAVPASARDEVQVRVRVFHRHDVFPGRRDVDRIGCVACPEILVGHSHHVVHSWVVFETYVQ